ncbi:MAG TPA: autotransporter outer membrane beta-barrel domain-containing protein [Thermoanaerobaculia bacterium]|nr:autotransporter outer membrane beta-barrel domain-containing protein [Thermoanaerobaculia bacterium]
MTSKAMRTTLILAGLLLAVTPAWAQRYQQPHRGFYERDGAFRLFVGDFRPEGDSEYWNDKDRLFTGAAGGAEDMENASFGLSYLLPLSRYLSLEFAGTAFSGDTTQSYRDFVDNFGDRIRHDTSLDLATATVGVVLHPLGSNAPVSPYIGAGAGSFFWSLEEKGDFIDFGHNNEVFFANLKDDGVAFGYYYLLGLEAPITQRLSLFGEGRWSHAKDTLSDDFEGFGDLDLSGTTYLVGISWNL